MSSALVTGLSEIHPDHASVLDALGHPHGREAGISGLYFCGFEHARGGLLRQIGIEARRIGQDIAAKFKGATP